MSCMSVLHAFFGDARWSRISETIARHERVAIPQSHLMPTVQECFGRLVSRPTAVITLLPGDVATDVLEFHGLRIGQEIDVVVGRDPEMRPKPEPDGVIDACRILGVEPASTTMIGDSTSGCAGGSLPPGATFVGSPRRRFEEDMRERIPTAPDDGSGTARARPRIVDEPPVGFPRCTTARQVARAANGSGL